ncbi:maleylpyruvate isomerase family mycothiol-dependent enzyme [Streptomyces sp. CMSTAAHL-2]|uniref:maleylpyruvate isomerase family mycothiol-dependent enzyme n=1 Tax=Streptomyces sp. CMSTAAHL-2 TaxID=2904522 RepID=UPI001E5CCFD4|nr:maleylpyruvate isomerase family mycothiol-dependent enzyme [Streptomyces sp. CMSTAAHL-2]MCE3033353.1 maleylpyruvate isomerase family mycothiol-dependent enzyme [Streptomyces sp. CMSTAAHL-2]
MQGLGALDPITASTNRFVATVASLTDAQVAGDTLVPPWTRGHVITHVARATDSICRLLAWARTGVETPQYASMDARAAEIEAGARRPVADLVADVRDTAARFEEAVRTLPSVAWHTEVRMRTGELRTPATLVLARLRELEIHHADLDAGYGFSDIPVDAARWIIDDIVEALARRPETPALRLETTDTGLVHALGIDGPAVRGRQADILAWLSGRSPGTALTASGADAVPAAPFWI